MIGLTLEINDTGWVTWDSSGPPHLGEQKLFGRAKGGTCWNYGSEVRIGGGVAAKMVLSIRGQLHCSTYTKFRSGEGSCPSRKV